MNYIAVLCSGGLDSAVLVALALQQAERVVPIHVAVGFAWENEERRMLDRLLAAPPFAGRVQPLVEPPVRHGGCLSSHALGNPG